MSRPPEGILLLDDGTVVRGLATTPATACGHHGFAVDADTLPIDTRR